MDLLVHGPTGHRVDADAAAEAAASAPADWDAGSWTYWFVERLFQEPTGSWIYWFSFHSTRWMLLSGMLVANNRPESLAPSRPSSHDVTPARKLDPRLDFL